MRDRHASLITCICAVVLAAVPILGQSTQAAWQQYSYPKDGFAISAPSQPTFSNQVKATDVGNVEIHTYTVPLGSDGVVMISSSAISGLEKDSPKNRLQKAKSGALEAGNAKLTSEKEIMLGAYPGLQYEAMAANLHVRARMYIVKNLLFQLLEISPLNVAFPADADRICTSFRLVH